jgi:uncharacterized protein (DUF2235 family)
MKRIVILIDGTWNKEGDGQDTNVAKLDDQAASGTTARAIAALIKSSALDGTKQCVRYHDGVGAEGGLLERALGGAIGLGLRKIVGDCYEALVRLYDAGDEVYIFGFSRGAYAARALAGLIGASGIQTSSAPPSFDAAWNHYRVKPAVRAAKAPAAASDQQALATYRQLAAAGAFHKDSRVRCVGVWDTVGSYGVPAGFGLAPLARYFALELYGFHDTQFGDHVDVGLHAVAVDERRRPFVPTFWTKPKGQALKQGQVVEQTWFAGAHENVGGGYADARLSDIALIWMVARVMALTKLEFDQHAVRQRTVGTNTGAIIDGEVYDSARGWPVSQLFPHSRVILSPDAIAHGVLLNSADPAEEHINERIHWSVLAKRGRPCTVFGVPNTRYEPANLPADVPPERVADVTAEERALLPGS